VNSFLVALSGLFIAAAFQLEPIYLIAAFILPPLLFVFLLDTLLRIIADSRARICEAAFPDVLILMSSNIKAGLTPDKALNYSIREEFGPLAKELQHASRRANTGLNFSKVLMEVPNTIKSNLIRGSIRLIVEGLEGGGELSSLLEETAKDIRNMELIRKEVQAQVRTYSVFIFFAAVIGAPILFSVSVYLVRALAIINPIDLETLPPQAQRNLPFLSMKPPEYGVEFLNMYVLSNLFIISIFAGLLIGLIEKGNELRGAKYIPILLTVALTIFYLTNWFVSNVSGVVSGLGV
jgi:archaellum biogenesis protein FlaJ (TadC family)